MYTFSKDVNINGRCRRFLWCYLRAHEYTFHIYPDSREKVHCHKLFVLHILVCWADRIAVGFASGNIPQQPDILRVVQRGVFPLLGVNFAFQMTCACGKCQRILARGREGEYGRCLYVCFLIKHGRSKLRGRERAEPKIHVNVEHTRACATCFELLANDHTSMLPGVGAISKRYCR